MKLAIEIPKEFEADFQKDRFADALLRIRTDIRTDTGNGSFMLSGKYETETLDMLRAALAAAKVIGEVEENGPEDRAEDLPGSGRKANFTEVFLFSDGSARGNPDGPGGYGTILRVIGKDGTVHEKELSQGFGKTTNNRMELMGVIAGLESLKKPCRVFITTDSQYVVNAFNKGWIISWQAHGWKKADKKPVLNTDLWKRLLAAAAPHEITWNWVRGHAGHPENERCDKLATSAADAIRKEKKQ